MKADLVATVSRVRTFQFPGFGPATLTDGQGYLHQHLQFWAPMTQARVETAATSLGYRLATRFAVPDGRELRAWTCTASTGSEPHVGNRECR